MTLQFLLVTNAASGVLNIIVPQGNFNAWLFAMVRVNTVCNAVELSVTPSGTTPHWRTSAPPAVKVASQHFPSALGTWLPPSPRLTGQDDADGDKDQRRGIANRVIPHAQRGGGLIGRQCLQLGVVGDGRAGQRCCVRCAEQ